MYLRDTLRLLAKGLRPSAHPIFPQPARGRPAPVNKKTNLGERKGRREFTLVTLCALGDESRVRRSGPTGAFVRV